MPEEDYELLSAWTLHTLKAYFEAILREQREATNVASVEREKAASIAREGLHEQFKAGDTALERHIAEQVQQIRQVIDLNERAVVAAFDASEKAIQKAEIANEKRFDSANGFRGQLSDQAASFATREVLDTSVKQIHALIERNREDLAEQRGMYLPVTTFDSALSEWTTWRNKVDVRDGELAASTVSRQSLDDVLAPLNENVAGLASWQSKIIGALGLLGVFAPLATGIIVYFFTTTGP